MGVLKFLIVKLSKVKGLNKVKAQLLLHLIYVFTRKIYC
jgi:hypothetical protein